MSPKRPTQIELDEIIQPHTESRRIFDALARAVDAAGPADMRPTKSQVAFWRKHPFVWAWRPGQYLHGEVAPLVLTVSFSRRDPSPRWKQVVEPSPGRFTHHLELWSEQDIDNEVLGWLKEAWEAAGP